MTDSLITLSPAALGVVVIVVGLVQISKMYIDGRWAPLSSLVLGVVGAFLGAWAGLIPGANVSFTVLTGLVMGLTAAGIFSGVKATFASSNPV